MFAEKIVLVANHETLWKYARVGVSVCTKLDTLTSCVSSLFLQLNLDDENEKKKDFKHAVYDVTGVSKS